MERMLTAKSFDSFTKAVKSLRGELSATPERIVKEMFSRLDSIDWKNPDLKILDPAAGFGTFLREAYIRLKEFHSEEHIINNMLYACEINGFKTFFLEKKMGLRNIYKGDFLTMKLPEGWPKEFNIVVSNPPYGTRTNKLDLKFIEKSLDLFSERMVIVHPASSYIDVKDNNKYYQEINRKTSEFLEEIVLFNGNGVFEIGPLTPCSIISLNRKKEVNGIRIKNLMLDREDFGEIDKLTPWGIRPEFYSFKEKISGHTNGSLHSEGNVLGTRGIPELRNSECFFVEFSSIRTGVINGGDINEKMYLPQFFTFISKNNLVINQGRNPEYKIWFEFSSSSEASNFLTYLKTDFARMCLALSKTNSHLDNGELKSIPWMDFSQVWTDDKLFKHFNVSQEERNFISEIIPPYYD